MVGAREWNGKHMDVPAMGYDQSIETAGYLDFGDNVRFELLDLDGEIHILTGPNIPLWDNNQIFHTGILANINIPNDISIISAYPNPFNPITNIEFALNSSSDINISIYDVNGRLIETLIDDSFYRGFYSVDWNASAYPSGVYFIRIISGDTSDIQKLVLMK